MLKTPAKAQREARDRKVHATYLKLIARGAMKTAAEAAVIEKFAIARSTVWRINQRVTNAKSV